MFRSNCAFEKLRTSSGLGKAGLEYGSLVAGKWWVLVSFHVVSVIPVPVVKYLEANGFLESVITKRIHSHPDDAVLHETNQSPEDRK